MAFCRNITKEDLDGLGCSKLRMWSQYGEDHRGVCLVFSKKLLLEEIDMKYNRDTSKVLDGNLNYTTDMWEIFHELSIDLPRNIKNKGQVKEVLYLEAYYRGENFLFVKHQDYEDENEYQIVMVRKFPINRSYYIDVSRCLTGIILGDRFPEVHRPTIENLGSGYYIAYGKLRWRYGEWNFYSWINDKQQINRINFQNNS